MDKEISELGGLKTDARDTACLRCKLTGPRMRRGACSWSDVSPCRCRIDSPLQGLIGKRSDPIITRRAYAGRQIARVAGDRQGHSRGRRGINGGKHAVRARRSLIGPANRDDADIRIHPGRP